jgi:hypothetical protein
MAWWILPVIARSPMVTRIAERSADSAVAKSGLVAHPSRENALMGTVSGREKRPGRSDFHPPLQGEGRGPKGRGVGSTAMRRLIRANHRESVARCPSCVGLPIARSQRIGECQQLEVSVT